MTQHVKRRHNGAVVTHWPSPSEVRGSNPGPCVESWYLLTDGQPFTVQNLDQLYVLVSSAHKTTHRDMSYTELKVDVKPKVNKYTTCLNTTSHLNQLI